jgi:hypothetical protein
MYYRTANELLINSPRVNGTSVSRYIHRDTKKDAWGRLNFLIAGEIKKNDLTLRWHDADANTVNDVFNYVPMILNYLSLKGYRKILFVGHYNSAVRSWTFQRGTDRNIHMTPTVKAHEDTMVDPNVWTQFIPIVKMAYGYDVEMHTVVPPELRHRKLMHSLYKRYEVDLVPADKQYKGGQESLGISPPPDTTYDCVVLAGVPKETEGTAFTYHHVKSVFAPYCDESFDIIDINYQDPDKAKYIEGAVEENEEWLNQVFVNRSIWDNKFREMSEEDRAIEYSVLDGMIRCHKG